MKLQTAFLAVIPVLGISLAGGAAAQETYPYTGIFEGVSDGRAYIRTTPYPDGSWTIEPFTEYRNGTPTPGDWIEADVDAYGRIVDITIQEYPSRYSGVVDHIEGNTVAVRTSYGMQYVQQTAITWQVGVGPNGLVPGDQIDVASYRNRTIAYVRVTAAYSPPPPPPLPVSNAPVDEEITAQVAPPPLPAYDVPPCPEPDDIWVPGYWHWGPFGYYWVPGVWMAAPEAGLYWTPGYWGFEVGFYRFHPGYWGHHVGYYGGINYGGGYYGEGFHGGRWVGGHVEYNTAVVSVNPALVHRTYVNDTVTIHNQPMRVRDLRQPAAPAASFHGQGGIATAPSATEQRWSSENHVRPTTQQIQHIQAAQSNPQLQHAANGGAPALLTAPRPLAPAAVGSAPAAPSYASPRNPPPRAPAEMSHGAPSVNSSMAPPPPRSAPMALTPPVHAGGGNPGFAPPAPPAAKAAPAAQHPADKGEHKAGQRRE